MTDRPLCLVTGASAGIGAACARLAAAKGYDVALTYNSDAEGAARVAAACNAEGVRTLVIQMDVAKETDIAAMYDQIDDHFGRLDALVNNAGIVGQTARLTDMPSDRIRQIFDVNVIGAMLVAQGAVKRMEPQGKGVIINISSAAARLGSANQYLDYAASKGALDTLTVGLAKEVAGEGIRVNAVRPGLIDTEIHASAGEAGRVTRLAEHVPIRRGGTPDEVAEAIVWLLSAEASYTTGALLDVAGGR